MNSQNYIKRSWQKMESLGDVSDEIIDLILEGDQKGANRFLEYYERYAIDAKSILRKMLQGFPREIEKQGRYLFSIPGNVYDLNCKIDLSKRLSCELHPGWHRMRKLDCR
jgi:hypothetical protein